MRHPELPKLNIAQMLKNNQHQNFMQEQSLIAQQSTICKIPYQSANSVSLKGESQRNMNPDNSVHFLTEKTRMFSDQRL